MRSRTPVGPVLLSHLRISLTRIGTPVGWWLLEDFLAGKVKRAKLYIFPNAFVLTSAQRARIREILKRQKATAVWFYAPGFIDPGKGDARPEYIRDLTGIPVQPLPDPLEDTLQPVSDSSLCSGVTEAFGSRRGDLRTRWAVVPSGGARPLAVYAGKDQPVGAALSEQDGWRSVFIASLYAPPELLRNIARSAGVWIYCDTNDVVLGDGHFLSLAASEEGEKILHLPRPSTLTDSLTGQKVASGRRITLRMKKGETRLFWVQNP